MDKLGLKIVKTQNGYQDVVECNGNKVWEKNVRDTRRDHEVIKGMDKGKNPSVIMYTADTNGQYYAVIAGIDGRITDYIAAWIFRPWTIDIKGPQLAEIIAKVKNEILSPEINPAKMQELFNTAYPMLAVPFAPIATEGSTYAVRYYNRKGADYSFAEILEGMSQSVNKKYKAIFLIDADTEVNADCDDISSSKLERTVIINPPSQTLLSQANEFKPYVNNELFNHPIRAYVGTAIQITWKRDNFKTVVKNFMVTENVEAHVFDIPKMSELQRHISFSNFKIIDNRGARIEGAVILVNNTRITNDFYCSESATKDALVSVTCEGYEKIPAKKYDITKPVIVQLSKIEYTYILRTQSEDDDPIKLEFKSKKKYTKVPLEGYADRGQFSPMHENFIDYKPSGLISLKMSIISIIGALVIGIAIGGLSAWLISTPEDNVQSPGQTTPTTQTPSKSPTKTSKPDEKETQKVDSTTLEFAIRYLDNKPKWIKAEMEKYPDLKGLWDQLNDRDFASVIKNEQKLNTSKNFKALCDQIKKLKDKNAYKGKKYDNAPDASEITYDAYIENIKTKIIVEKASHEPSPEAVSTEKLFGQ